MRLNKNYGVILSLLKEKIKRARDKAISAVNTQLLVVYWEIGKTILEQLELEGWGTKVIDRLSADLKAEFPEMKGLSVRNIKYMRAFAEAYPLFIQSSENQSNYGVEKVQEGLAQLLLGQENLLCKRHLHN